jgi:hypothetical protein
LAAGCAAPRLAPIDLAEPGWTVRESAAVWHPPGNAPELAGEILVASHPDGRLFVQFSKQTLPVVAATATPAGWSVGSPLRRGAVGGRGRPTDRVPWFQIRSLPPGDPASQRWQLVRSNGVPWRLRAVRGNEFVEGSAP